MVTSTISGTTLKVNKARRGLMLSITPTMPTSSSVSPTIVISPCDSSSLITATSLITRVRVTPMMCVSW